MGLSTNVLKFDMNNNVEDFTFVLATRNQTHLGKLNNIKRDTVTYKGNLNGFNEISFEIYKTVDGEVEELWDKIIDLRLLWVQDLKEYFEIKVSYEDKLDEYKVITGTSLCEAELGQLLITAEINTDDDMERTDYVETKFYNPDNPKASLLHRVLKDKAPHYKIKHVDTSLCDLQRRFSINGTAIYDFLTGECSEQFNCLFTFNSVERSISVYDLYTGCKECGHRGSFNDVCPKCGSTLLSQFGEDTTIFVDKENLTDSVKFETDADAIKNCFKLVAGDEDMTAAIRSLNQNGTDYMYYISPEQKEDMSVELVNAIESYDALYESYTEEYERLLLDFYELTDEKGRLEHSMFPPIEQAEVNASTEVAKLTEESLSPLGLEGVSEITNTASVDRAIENYARIIVKSGYVKVKVSESTFTYVGDSTNGSHYEDGVLTQGTHYGIWIGKIKVTNYSDSEDIAETDELTIIVHDNYEDFLKQKVMKDMSVDDEEGNIFNVLDYENLDKFKEALTHYNAASLNSFDTALQSALTTLMSVGQADEKADFYADIYKPYLDKKEACAEESNKRDNEISEIKKELEVVQTQINEIQKALNFEAYLGEELFTEFCSYRREDEYNNSNFISDGLDNAEMIQNARDFLDTAKKELIKAATRQHSISTTLYNLLVMPEFKELVKKFSLGNFIRVRAGKDIYRLRLVSYTINFSDMQTIAVEFSDMTKTADGMNDVESLVKSAQSMATNFSYISKQAEKGQKANEVVVDFVEEGLNSANVAISNNTNEEVIYDKNGILCRTYDDIEGTYSPEQLRITHNIMCYTKDNWRNVVSSFGKHNYYKFVKKDPNSIEVLVKDTDYGLTSQFVAAGFVYSSQIISGDIYSKNYSSTAGTHMNLEDGSFNFGHKIIYDAPSNKMTMKGVDIEWSSSTTPKIGDIDGLSNTLSTQSASITANSNAITAEVKRATEAEGSLSSRITVNANSITSEVTRAKGVEEKLSTSITQNANNIALKVSKTDYNGKEVVSLINQTAEAVSINANKINLNGAVTANNYFKINTDGSMESISGKIGGWTIAKTYIGASVDGKGSIYITSPEDSNYWIRTHNAANGGGTRTFSVSKAGQLYARGADISGKLTAGSDSRLGSGSFIGSEGAGWKITNNQIHTVKTVSNSDTSPLMTLSAGSTAEDTFIIAPYCFQIGGKFTYGDVPSGEIIGANFTRKVYITGGLKVTNGDCVIGGNCNITGTCNISGDCDITGAVTANKITITGEKSGTGIFSSQLGGFYITDKGDFEGTRSKTTPNTSCHLEFYPNGSNYDGTGYFIALVKNVVTDGSEPIVRKLTKDGWV